MDSERAFTVAKGVTLHYRLWRGRDRRPLLVLLHGMASNLTRWSEFFEHTILKERFDILRLDLRGHGGSFTRQRVGMEVWSDDLAAILKEQGYDSGLFVGHSLSANLALHFAARYPENVSALVLIDPVFTDALRGQALWVYRLSPLLRIVIFLIRVLNALGLHRRQIPNRDLRQLDEHVRKQLLGAGKEEDFVKRYTSPLADMKHIATATYLQEFIEITRPIPPTPLRAPILVLISQAVTFTDTDATRAALARYPNCEIVKLSAYHWPLTEKPVEVRQTIEAWCAKFLARTR